MEDDERAAYDALLDPVTIYRGDANAFRVKRGLSWTVSRNTALHFAKRFGRKRGCIGTATVPKADVPAFLNNRSEQEVIVLPPLKQLSIEAITFKRPYT